MTRSGIRASEPVSDSGNDTQDHLDDPRVAEIVQEYMSQLDQGKNPDRQEYMSRVPGLAGAISACLDGLEMVRSMGMNRSGTRSATMRSHSAEPSLPGGTDYRATPLGDFQIVRELARGGMGIVYEAVQLSLGRRVALKVLPFAATLDSRQLQRFKTEAQAAALLHHPNIVPVFAVGCERGVHFYAMQLIDGQSLAEMIRQLRRQAGHSGPEDLSSIRGVRSSQLLGNESMGSSTVSRAGNPSPVAVPTSETLSQFHTEMSTQHAGREGRFFRTAARLMLQAAQALEHAHEFGIIHRDIKPANLLLDVNGILWVTDFGLAQFHSDAGLTRTGDIPGTIRYMSPEQASGRRALLDQRSDVYSLGATFYELLTLEPIFRGRDVQYLLNQILHTEPRPLRQVDKAIPVELETIILKCVSKNPEDRYRSAESLAADLQRYLDHQPIQARRPTVVDRVKKWSLRHPGGLAAGMFALLVIAVGLFVSNQMISREQKNAEQRAKEAERMSLLYAQEQQRAEERAKEAEQMFQQARQAVDVLIDVSEGELADHWTLITTRQRMLSTALNCYQDFIEQRRGDSAEKGEMAQVQERIKGFLRDLNVMQRDLHLRLVAHSGVQSALSLTDDQQFQLGVFLVERDQAFVEFRKQMPQLDDEARRKRFVSLLNEQEQVLDGVLNAQQRERLSQIAVQYAGVMAFRNAQVVDALNLTAQQRKSIRLIEGEFWRRLAQNRIPIDSSKSAPAKMTREEAVDKVLKFLDEEQRQVWKRLIGEPFSDFPDFPFRPNQRPAGGRDG